MLFRATPAAYGSFQARGQIGAATGTPTLILLNNILERNQTKSMKRISCLWIKRLNIVKMIMFPKLGYRFNIIPTEIPGVFFAKAEKLILKLIRKCKRPRK